ncbi:MAG: WGxxGxxG-CTERM domain-containing protein [Acidobacteria bacterium]|nr:WGxxGxxG-CTERM domain-containing protein [Acidobacteriota bacterium]MCA1608119.1 WGxxGxxG-CTERM domain-containing protein [Acidobacteriota bacterium]
MKKFVLSKTVRAAMLASALMFGSVIPAPAQAANNTSGGYTGPSDRRDNDTDWGWLGLLGLAGLLGLIPKKRTADADHRGTDTGARTAGR